MFDSPIVFCSVAGAWVSLAQTQGQCAACHRCGATDDCSFAACFIEGEENGMAGVAQPSGRNPRQSEIVLDLRRVHSEGNARSVHSALAFIQGVRAIRIADGGKQVTIGYDAAKAVPQQFERALRAVGFASSVAA